MRKLTTILLAVMLVVALFVSCDNNVSNNIEETVSVNFEGGRARNLTATLETFSKDNLYWRYTAEKKDTTGLKTGETSTEIAVKSSGAGLGSVSGFSQGKWQFTLFAYKDQGFKNLAYKGEIETSLKKDSDNKVLVTVSPVKTENVKGTLVIDAQNIKITKNGTEIEGATVNKVYKVVKVGSEDTTAFSTTTSYDLGPGAYKVTVAFVDDTASATYTYASGSVVATVYSNLTTTVTGGLEELVTKAVFDSAINPDIMNTVATSSTMEYSNLFEGTVALSTSAETDSDTAKVTATVTAADAKKIIQDVVGSDDADTTGTKVSLALSVDTTAATSNSLELEIGMSATVTNSKGEATTTEVKSLDSYSVVTINLQKQLTSVVVKHNGNEMTALKSEIDSETSIGDYGAYYYNADSGVLTIKTKTFSPFAVTYDAPVYVAKIGSKNYTSLQEALDSVGDGETITLYGNVTSDKGFIFSKNVTATLDLNGYTLKVTNGTETDKHGALYITNGTLTVTNGNQNGNVYDESTGTAYTLNSDGTITDSNCTTKSASDLGSNLVLLDCSLSNYVPDEFISKNWEVVHNNCSKVADCYHEKNTSDFSGGYGTKVEPYLVADKTQFQNITGKYDKYAYYKLTDNYSETDLEGWVPVSLHGSFDGNGKVLNNITSSLFRYVGYQLKNEDIVLKNLDATMNISSLGQYGADSLVKNIFNSGTTTFENINVHGKIESYWNIASFYNYGTANYGDEKGSDYTAVFKNCTSDATLICSTGETGGGFVGHGYEGTGNALTITFDENCKYTGEFYTINGNGHAYIGMWSSYETEAGSVDVIQIGSSEYENSNWDADWNKYASNNNKRITQNVPTSCNDGYAVEVAENVSYAIVSVSAQLTAYDDEGDRIQNLSGITLSLGSEKKEEVKNDTVLLAKVNSAVIDNNADAYGYSISNNVMTVNVPGNSNYKTGTVRLTVAQYSSDGTIVAAGTLDLYTINND